jgi:hypothetical protein
MEVATTLDTADSVHKKLRTLKKSKRIEVKPIFEGCCK